MPAKGTGPLYASFPMKETDVSAKTPIALTIAGSDSGGGAGIQADLKTFSAMGVYGASVITALTAQNTMAVTAVHEAPPQMIRAQIDAVLADLDVGAIKIGMLASVPVIEAVAEAMERVTVPIVLDPVMVAKSGDPLLQDNAVSALRERLVPLATVLTPNLPEAARLLEVDHVDQNDETMARQLLDLGADAVLLKGGHADGPVCVDLLLRRERPALRLSADRIRTDNTHGTGCTLSSAIAAGLALGRDLPTALAEAHAYLAAAIRAADDLVIGSGHGPVHHFHALWRPASDSAA